MKPPNEKQAASEIIDLLTDVFGSSPKAIKVQQVGAANRFDYAISIDCHRFIADYKNSASTASVAVAIDGLKRSAETNATAALPLIVVPYMGQVGRQLCDQARMAWLDLCGNAKIIAPGFRIWIEGRPNKYSDRGRPPNVFASKSSRVARQLFSIPDGSTPKPIWPVKLVWGWLRQQNRPPARTGALRRGERRESGTTT